MVNPTGGSVDRLLPEISSAVDIEKRNESLNSVVRNSQVRTSSHRIGKESPDFPLLDEKRRKIDTLSVAPQKSDHSLFLKFGGAPRSSTNEHNSINDMASSVKGSIISN